MRIAAAHWHDMTPTKQNAGRTLSRNSEGKGAAEMPSSGSKLCWQTWLHPVNTRATVNEKEQYKSAKWFPRKKRQTFVTEMIDQASSQPVLSHSRQIQRPSANFPPHNRIILPICSGVMCYHLLQHLQIQVRLVHEADPTLLMLLVLCYQPDNRYRCISSKSPGRGHVGHLKLRSSSQEHRHPMKGRINWHAQ